MDEMAGAVCLTSSVPIHSQGKVGIARRWRALESGGASVPVAPWGIPGPLSRQLQTRCRLKNTHLFGEEKKTFSHRIDC